MNTSPEIHTTLRSLGLTEREVTIYLAALEAGPSLQLPLAQKAGIKRTSMRELLPDMLHRGILQEVVRGRRKYLAATDPRQLVEDLQSRAKKASDALPLLLALQTETQDKPEVRFYDGTEGIKRVYEETLKVGLPLYSFVNVAAIHPDLEDWLVHSYVPRRHEKNVQNYVLVSNTPGAKELIPDDPWRHNKFVDPKKFPFKMEVLIFGDFVAFVHFSKFDEPSATLVQSQSAATTLRSAHQLAWELLGK
jgi:predicted DNA-binding transcriptional regulator